MNRTRRRLYGCVLAVVTIALLLGSAACAEDPLATAPEQVSAALYIQEWSQILWGLVTSQTGTEIPSFDDPVINPDGSISQSFTTADGTQATLTAFVDGSASIDILLPDGTGQTVLQSVPVFDGMSTTTIDWEVTSSEGLWVQYTSAVDDRGTLFDMSDDITELVGSSILSDGITQDFYVLTADGLTEVESTQSDGTVFTLSVPLALPDFVYPDPSQQATGTYSGPGFSMEFQLMSTPANPTRWSAFISDLGPNGAGTFALHRDFSGFGQLIASDSGAESIVALLSWSQQGQIDLDLFDTQARYMGPSGAALDFLQNRWNTLTALLAPAPGAGFGPSRFGREPRSPRLDRTSSRRLRTARTPAAPVSERHR